MKNKSNILNVKALAKTQYLSLYDVTYHNKCGKEKHWSVASRKPKEVLEESYFNHKPLACDAVVIVAYHQVLEKLVLIKQYRVPIGEMIYELPAGLIEKDKSIYEMVEKELKEETGLKVTKILEHLTQENLYLSAGMSDESVALVYCLCEGNLSTQYLEEDEEITPLLVSTEQAEEILKNNMAKDIKVQILLSNFVRFGSDIFK